MSKLAVVLVYVFLSVNACASGYKADELHEMRVSILQHNENISALTRSISDYDEKDTSLKIRTISSEILTELGFFVDLGDIYAVMVNRYDKNEVRNLINKNKKYFDIKCKNTATVITEYLTFIKNLALISETEKTRDDILKTCGLVRAWK